jgi:DNA-binding NarL/FixJ family response regulator
VCTKSQGITSSGDALQNQAIYILVHIKTITGWNGMKSSLRVLIIDDHPLFSEGMAGLLVRLNPEVAVSQAKSVPDAERLAGQCFDLVLLDLQMPGTSGMEALLRIKTLFEGSSVVVISGDESHRTIRQAIQHGAAGYLPKSTDPLVTIQALQLVMNQGTYLPPEALNRAATLPCPEVPAPVWPQALSPRQLAVLRCLLQGKPNKVIARDMGIAEGTVKAHLWAVYQLIGVSSRTQAMYRAHELKLFGDLHPENMA